jgi:hypothetical protein
MWLQSEAVLAGKTPDGRDQDMSKDRVVRRGEERGRCRTVSALENTMSERNQATKAEKKRDRPSEEARGERTTPARDRTAIDWRMRAP